MKELNINLLCSEAERLLKQEEKLLESIKKSKNLLDSKDNGSQTFNIESISKDIEIIREESYKINNLELVIAVVGTMKAGKSTTINAIVGMEVLPNRNRPMTAIPTLIRHTKGITEPRLIFQNTKPINDLIDKLNKNLIKAPNELIESLSKNSDMRELLTQIKNKQYFVDKYNGRIEIFNFLKGLNDLVRLSTELNIDFPFAEYGRIENLPRIEVEFIHLSQMGHVQGHLTLLDTPGPNESGQTHLRPMLRNQLKKASAVLAVLDYTQLKSDADNDIRDDLKDIANVTGDRLYTLVNRFDQKDRHSDSADEVREYVANSLMKDLITADRVYPVSARYGYLASQAKNELALRGKLPDYSEHSWVEDFAQIAMGRKWKNDIDDNDEVSKAADELWQDSYFDEPLDNVIRQAYSKAAILTIESAASKLCNTTEKIKNFLGVRKQSFKKSVDELQIQIDSLQSDIEAIQKKEKGVNNNIKLALDDVTKSVKKTGSNTQKETLSTLDEYFEEGKKIEIKNKKASRKQSKKKQGEELGSISRFLRNKSDSGSEKKDFEKSDSPLRFETKKEANDLLKRIGSSIDKVSMNAEILLLNDIQDKIEGFNKSFQKNIDETQHIINNLKKDMQDFDLTIRLPDIKDLQLDIAVKEVLADSAQQQKEQKTRRRRKDSVWGKVCGFFNSDDWGYEEYKVSVNIYYVDIQHIKKQVKEELERSFLNLESSFLLTIKQQLEEQVNSFFTALREKVEFIRGDLKASIDDRSKSKEEQQILLDDIIKIEKLIPNLLKDSEELLTDIENLSTPMETVQ